MSMLKYWIWLSERQGLSLKSRQALLEAFDDPRSLYFAAEHELKDFHLREMELAALRDKSLTEAQSILNRCTELNVQILTLQDAAYPNRLRNIFDPPLVLYVLGQLPPVDEFAAIAIVGTRKATPYGIKMGRRMGYELTKGGALVISGLAEGVDSAGAEGALRAGGKCIGVLGTAIDQVYPKFNQPLFEDVRAVGALISEYPPGAAMQRGTFPRRNRILSGLAAGVVVIEAPAKSGALITASRALEQGRDLFVVPGNADSPKCEGSNELIRDCAKAVTCGADVLCEYTSIYSGIVLQSRKQAEIPQEQEVTAENLRTVKEPREIGKGFLKLRIPRRKQTEETQDTDEAKNELRARLEMLSEKQLKLVAVMSKPSMHVDDIIDLSGLTASEVLAEMTMLEIEGIVTQEKGKRFSLNLQHDRPLSTVE